MNLHYTQSSFAFSTRQYLHEPQKIKIEMLRIMVITKLIHKPQKKKCGKKKERMKTFNYKVHIAYKKPVPDY